MAGSGRYGFRLGDRYGRIQVAGLKEVQYSLNALGKDAKNDMKPAHKAAAELVVYKARPAAPYRTGKLAESLRPFARQRAGIVRAGNKTNVPYAGPIIFGWPMRGIRANPFIYEAADSRRAEIVALYEKRMGELITKHRLRGDLAQAAIVESASTLAKAAAN
jgi:hypothetical protein